MGFVFLLLVVGLPIADLASLIGVGGRLGVLATLALLIAAMVVGTTLVRWQGLAVGREARADLAAGRLPVAAAFDSFCLLVAGGLFMLPGFVSDVLALLLLLPPARLGLRFLLARALVRRGGGDWPIGPVPGPARPPAGRGVILEGEVLRGDAGEDGGTETPSRPPGLIPPPPASRPAGDPSGRPPGDGRGVVPPDDPC